METTIQPDDIQLRQNLGTRPVKAVRNPGFPDAGAAVRHQTHGRPEGAVDVLLVNPPSPDGGIWIRSQHRVGRRSREEMVWPQVSLAQLAAHARPRLHASQIVDAIAERMTWPEFEQLLRATAPKYYLTQVTAPTLTNDMYGVCWPRAWARGRWPSARTSRRCRRETMRDFPALDFVLRGEPELTFRELLDVLEGAQDRRAELGAERCWRRPIRAGEPSPDYATGDTRPRGAGPDARSRAWSGGGSGEIVRQPRPPVHPRPGRPADAAAPPVAAATVPRCRMMKGPFTFIVTSRGCTAGLQVLHQARELPVVGAPALAGEHHGGAVAAARAGHPQHPHVRRPVHGEPRAGDGAVRADHRGEAARSSWTCNSRVDYVDEEMLRLMGQAGCWLISLGHRERQRGDPEAGAKGDRPGEGAAGAELGASRRASRTGATSSSGCRARRRRRSGRRSTSPRRCRSTSPCSTSPRRIRARRSSSRWWRTAGSGPGTRWEEVDMDQAHGARLRGPAAEDWMYWQKRAFREWALRPGPDVDLREDALQRHPHLQARPARRPSAPWAGRRVRACLRSPRQPRLPAAASRHAPAATAACPVPIVPSSWAPTPLRRGTAA